MDNEQALREQIIELSPWHMDVQVTSGVSTRVSREMAEDPDCPARREDPDPVAFTNPREQWTRLLTSVHPGGLEGRSFLDCACNCGGYAFWTKEIGASRCFGFDVREHWIRQANFLAENRAWPSDGIAFEKLDLYELPRLDLEPFDITLFKGIFYHLPDPIRGLRIAADLSRELLILDTAYRNDQPDGMLVLAEESKTRVMSGVYGLNWFPTGPGVLTRVLRWMGFPESRITGWRPEQPGRRADVGRLTMVAARTEGLLDELPSVEEPRR